MKTNTSLLLPIAAFALSVAWTPQAAARDISIAGSLAATEEVEIDFPVMTAEVSGQGQAQHLGHYALHMDVTVNLIANASVGTFSIEAANGDQLIGTSVGISGTLTNKPNVYLLVELLTIQSGTGRFAGASGTILVTRLANSVTLRSSGTIEGTVSLPDNRGHHQ